MKRISIYLIGIICLGLSFFLILSTMEQNNHKSTDITNSTEKFNNPELKKKLHFNLGIDTDTLNFLHTNYEDIYIANNNKLGRSIDKSSINLQIFDFEKVGATTLYENKHEEFSAATKGIIKTPEGNFNFEGSGSLYKVELSNNEIIYSGSLSGNFKNKINEEIFTVSLRHNPNTNQIDVNFLSGAIGVNAILPFGKAFLSEQQIIEIEENIRK